jgi:hypothetical protein
MKSWFDAVHVYKNKKLVSYEPPSTEDIKRVGGIAQYKRVGSAAQYQPPIGCWGSEKEKAHTPTASTGGSGTHLADVGVDQFSAMVTDIACCQGSALPSTPLVLLATRAAKRCLEQRGVREKEKSAAAGVLCTRARLQTLPAMLQEGLTDGKWSALPANGVQQRELLFGSGGSNREDNTRVAIYFGQGGNLANGARFEPGWYLYHCVTDACDLSEPNVRLRAVSGTPGFQHDGASLEIPLRRGEEDSKSFDLCDGQDWGPVLVERRSWRCTDCDRKYMRNRPKCPDCNSNTSGYLRQRPAKLPGVGQATRTKRPAQQGEPSEKGLLGAGDRIEYMLSAEDMRTLNAAQHHIAGKLRVGTVVQRGHVPRGDGSYWWQVRVEDIGGVSKSIWLGISADSRFGREKQGGCWRLLTPRACEDGASSDSGLPVPSPYEIQRLKNIKRNTEIMEQLGLIGQCLAASRSAAPATR